MQAIVVHQTQEGPRLSWETVADIDCGSQEVVVEVKATAVNRADLLQARGLYPPPSGASPILGLEAAGTVAAVGETVRSWQIGDRVCALLSGGGYAQRVAVPHSHLFRLPDHWSFDTAAAFPEVWLTAFVNLFMEAQLQAGEKVLIHAGGSGVGTAAIQLAHAAGANIYSTAGTAAKRDACRQLGATLAIDYKKDDFAALIKTATQGHGVDVVLDPVGASYLVKNIKTMAVGGRLVNIGLMGGTEAQLDMGLLLGKSLRLIGSRLRSRSDDEKALIIQTFKDRFWPLLESKRLHPLIDRTYPIGDAQSAHAYVRQNRNLGKVVLQVENG